MKLFQKIPDRFFSILSSTKKELYVEALFVLREAFLSEMEIRRDDLASMLIDRLEDAMISADFSEEENEEETIGREQQNTGAVFEEDPGSLSGRAYLLIRRLRETGWLEIDFDSRTFEYYITIPDYAVTMMDVLYSLSQEKVQEYNSYVYATYAALENAQNTNEYQFQFQALLAAHQNTEHLVRELKSLYNNIRRYQQSTLNEMSANVLLTEHFDEYREQIVNAVYYPLKTIDSVPRFKHRILAILNQWAIEDGTIDTIICQGVERHVFSDEEEGREEVLSMINYVADTYESAEETIGKIDRRHTEYTRAAVERIRYIINSDRSARGKLVDILQNSKNELLSERMQSEIRAYRHEYADHGSLYARVRRTKKTEGTPLAIESRPQNEALVNNFLSEIRKKYSNQKIDRFILTQMQGKDTLTTGEVSIGSDEEFIFFLLGTLRGREKKAPFSVEFLEGNLDLAGYSLPNLIFRRNPGKGTMITD